MKRGVLVSFVAVLALLFSVSGAMAQEAARTVLPQPDPPFKGKIGLTPANSVKDFPKPVTAPEGAPNVLIILTDDVGFGASSTFGGPIPTPTMDRIANAGLRYNNFHTTALCSPTRAALLTGRNHHSAATGVIMEAGVGYPGYNTLEPQSKRGMGDILKLNGYNTAWFGKNHNVPDWQTSQAGPFDLWPAGLGFEYFYGFIGGDTNQWAPALVENTRPIEPPHRRSQLQFRRGHGRTRPSLGFACRKPWRQDEPFFAYYAPGTAHAPHHPPKEWVEKYKGTVRPGLGQAIASPDLDRQKEIGIVPAEHAAGATRPEGIQPGTPRSPSRRSCMPA